MRPVARWRAGAMMCSAMACHELRVTWGADGDAGARLMALLLVAGSKRWTEATGHPIRHPTGVGAETTDLVARSRSWAGIDPGAGPAFRYRRVSSAAIREVAMTSTDITVGIANEDWAGDARYFEYSAAADPIRSGHTPRVPIERFPAALHVGRPTGVVPLDLAGPLGLDSGPATSPALIASFVTISAGEQLATTATATSELFVVLRGSGRSAVGTDVIAWAEGDVFVLPCGSAPVHTAAADAAFYWVTDEPLLRYLGVAPTEARFSPTFFAHERLQAELDIVARDPLALARSRVSVLAATASQTQTLTATHVLWAMYGLLPVGAVQRPHRHQSVALDLIIEAQPGC